MEMSLVPLKRVLVLSKMMSLEIYGSKREAGINQNCLGAIKGLFLVPHRILPMDTP